MSGTFAVLLVASNAGGTAEEVLTLTVNPTAPVITSGTVATADQQAPFSYDITANYQPASFNATGLPSGLVVNGTTGVISGAVTATGTGLSNVTLYAINSTGTGTAPLALTVQPPAPVISSSNAATAGEGLGFNYAITASNTPTSFSATGLPGGLVTGSTTGIISGTANTTGTFPVTLSATNGGGTGTANLSLTILSAYNYWATGYFIPSQASMSGVTNMPEGDNIQMV